MKSPITYTRFLEIKSMDEAGVSWLRFYCFTKATYTDEDLGAYNMYLEF